VNEHKVSGELSPAAQPGNGQQAMFTAIDRQVLAALHDADLDNLKPLEALNLLAELKKQIKD
jgi:hypothetical protein